MRFLAKNEHRGHSPVATARRFFTARGAEWAVVNKLKHAVGTGGRGTDFKKQPLF
jgi:hypothetical protein